MSNHITIELCTDDRARLDKLSERMEAIITLTQFIIDNGISQPTPTVTVRQDTDELTKRLQEVVDRAKNPVESVEAQTSTITPIKEETQTETEEIKPTPTKTVSRTELGAKVRELMTNGHREQVKAIIQSYAPTVPGVPEDKLTECYEKLVKLEV